MLIDVRFAPSRRFSCPISSVLPPPSLLLLLDDAPPTPVPPRRAQHAVQSGCCVDLPSVYSPFRLVVWLRLPQDKGRRRTGRRGLWRASCRGRRDDGSKMTKDARGWRQVVLATPGTTIRWTPLTFSRVPLAACAQDKRETCQSALGIALLCRGSSGCFRRFAVTFTWQQDSGVQSNDWPSPRMVCQY